MIFKYNPKIIAALAAVGSGFAGLFGGWNQSLTTLCCFMGIDYVTGLVLALIWHKSEKTDDGSFESSAGAKGLARKCMILFVVFMMHRIDMALGYNYLRDSVAIAYTIIEALSIVENLGCMGVPMPEIVIESISILKKER